MSFLLDTDICSAFLKRQSRLAHRFFQHSGRLSISTVTLGELLTWALRRPESSKLTRAIEQDLLGGIQLLDFDRRCAEEFGKCRGDLLSRGIVVNPMDLTIGATAIAHDLTLVTHNVKDFARIPDLRVEDWLE